MMAKEVAALILNKINYPLGVSAVRPEDNDNILESCAIYFLQRQTYVDQNMNRLAVDG